MVRSSSGATLIEYRYDQYDRLVQEDNSITGRRNYYWYDDGGNITKHDEYDWSYGWIQQTLYTYADEWSDLLTSYKYWTPISNVWTTVNITYDNAGNPTTYKGNALTWQNGRQLATYGSNISYDYDYSGIRTKKTVNGNTTHYYLDGSRVVAETLNGNLNKWYYYDAQGIQGMWLSGVGEVFVEKNVLGDITGLWNTSGTKVGEYKYDAYGNCTITVDVNGAASANPFRYRGYYYDTETGFYYLQSRYYDPTTGRFINADDPTMLLTTASTVGGVNLYSYCGNNPIMHTDSTGEWFLIDDLIAAGVGLLAGVGGQFVGDMVSSLISGQWQLSSWEMYTGAAIGGAIGGWSTLYVGPVAGVGIGMGLQTAVGMGLENLTGTSSYSWEQILGATALSVGIGVATAGLGKYARISGITKGSHSFQQVWRANSTKMINHTIKNLAWKTIRKGIVSELVSAYTVGWLVSNIIQGGVSVMRENGVSLLF